MSLYAHHVALVLGNSDMLSEILRFQDGKTASNLKWYEDDSCACGHQFLIDFEENESTPTHNAYVSSTPTDTGYNMVQYLSQHLHINPNIILGDQAAAAGNIDIFNFALDNCQIPCSPQGVLKAAEGGHLSILKTLANTFNIATLPAIVHAVHGNQPEIIDYLLSTTSTLPRFLQQAYVLALTLGHNHLASRIFYHTTSPSCPSISPTPAMLALRSTRVLDSSIAHNQLPQVKALLSLGVQESHMGVAGAAKKGHLGMIRFMLEEVGSSSVSNKAVTEAAAAGQVIILHYLLTHCHTVRLEDDVLATAAANGHLNVLRYLLLLYDFQQQLQQQTQEQPENNGNSTLTVAPSLPPFNPIPNLFPSTSGVFSSTGSLLALSSQEEQSPYFEDDYELFDINPEEDLARVVVDITSLTFSSDILDNAAAEVVQYLTDYYLSHNIPPEMQATSDAMDRAADGGHMDVLQWLYGNRPEGFTITAINNAAANNHVGILQFLLENYPSPASPTPVPLAGDMACRNGHLDAVKLLYEKGSVLLRHQAAREDRFGDSSPSKSSPSTASLFTRNAFDWSIGNGHIDVAQFLFDKFGHQFSKAAVELAAKSGSLDALMWLNDNVDPLLFEATPLLAGFQTDSHTSDAADMAAGHGHCGTLQYLMTKHSLMPSSEGLDWAARRGHLPMLLLLLQRTSLKPSVRTLNWAIISGHYDIVYVLLEMARVLTSPSYAYSLATRFGSDDLSLWLNQHYKQRSHQEPKKEPPSPAASSEETHSATNGESNGRNQAVA